MKKMFNVVMIMSFSWLCGYVYGRIHFGYWFGYRADAPINFIIGAFALGGLIICFLKRNRLRPPKVFKTWKMRVCQLMTIFSFSVFGTMCVEHQFDIVVGFWGALINSIAILTAPLAILHIAMVIYYYMNGGLALIKLRRKIVWALTKPADDEQ